MKLVWEGGQSPREHARTTSYQQENEGRGDAGSHEVQSRNHEANSSPVQNTLANGELLRGTPSSMHNIPLRGGGGGAVSANEEREEYLSLTRFLSNLVVSCNQVKNVSRVFEISLVARLLLGGCNGNDRSMIFSST